MFNVDTREGNIQGKLGPKDDLGPVDTPNINRVKVISLFCTAHRLVRILLLLQRWRLFSPVAEKEIIMAPFIVLLLLIAILIILPGSKGVCLEFRILNFEFSYTRIVLLPVLHRNCGMRYHFT